MALGSGEPVTDEVARHTDACVPCRRLAGLGEPDAPRALVDLQTVDPALYHGRDPLAGGAGGMGTAVRAWDRRLGREVVIKQVAPGDADERAKLLARFEHEARVTARLDHPGIVTVHELGRWPDGEPFYTMPLVHGEPLDRAIAACQTHADRLALLPRIAAAIDAIAYAHDRAIVHRDLKPANVMLGSFGETIVIDWGLASDLEGAPSTPAVGEGAADLTELGAGTPAYMPPEQAAGAPPDPRADVYALGATLYHALSGTPPYDGPDARRRLREAPPPPLVEVAPEVPPDLCAIVDRAMARAPADRFASAMPLAEELRRFLGGQLTRTYRYRPGELLRHWVRRHRAAVRIGSVALVAIAAVGAWSVVRVVRARDRAETAQRVAELGRRDAEAALARSHALQASLLARGPTGRREAIELALQAVTTAGDDVPLEVAQGLFDALAAGPLATSLQTSGDPSNVVASPDGARVAIVERGVVTVWEARDGAAVATLTTDNDALWARFVGADRIAAWGLGPAVELWDLVGHRVVVDAGAGAGTLVAVDGERVITASGAGELTAWDPTGARHESAAASCAPSDLDADAGRVALACDRGVVVWDGATVTRLDEAHRSRDLELDARWLYAVLDDHEVVRWSLPDLAREQVVVDRDHVIYMAHPTPGDDALSLSMGVHAFVSLVGGAVTQTLVEPSIAPRTSAWAGTWYHQRAAVRIEPAIHDVALVMRGHRAMDQSYAAAALGGTRVAIATSSGEAWLWDSRLGVDAGVLPDHRTEIVGIATSGDRVITASLDGAITTTTLDGAIVDRAVTGTELLAWSPAVPVDRDRRVSAVASTATHQATGALDGSLTIGVARVPADRDAVAALAFVGDHLVSGHRSGAVRIRALDGTVQSDLHLDAAITRLLADGDGILIATAAGTGHRATLDGRVTPLPAAPLAVSENQDPAVVLAAPSGEVFVGERLLGKHELPVTVAAIAPDGGTAWTADVGGTIRAWELGAGRPGVVMAPGEGAVTALAVTPDGAWLIAGFVDGAVRALPANLTAAKRRACATLRDAGRATPPGACP